MCILLLKFMEVLLKKKMMICTNLYTIKLAQLPNVNYIGYASNEEIINKMQHLSYFCLS
jgi:hypothetical protein